jgi:hypothetical protein
MTGGMRPVTKIRQAALIAATAAARVGCGGSHDGGRPRAASA